MLRLLAFSLALVPLTSAARAQTALYTTDFEGAHGWTITSGCSGPYVRWRVGARGPWFEPVFPSGLHGLYFNDGTGTIINGHWCGQASSPVIELGQAAAPELRFAYAWEHEGGCAWDAFEVHVEAHPSGALLYSECLSAGAPAAVGWEFHVVPLDPAWGAVRVVFAHDTIDGWNGWEAGSWVDDVRVVDVTCGVTTQCAGNTQTNGAPAAGLELFGSPSVAANDLRLQGQGFPLHTFATAFAGPEPGHLPAGAGLRCIAAGTSARLGVSPTRAAGRPEWRLDLAAQPLATMAVAGAPLFVQAIYRDGATFNFSAGLRIDLCP